MPNSDQSATGRGRSKARLRNRSGGNYADGANGCDNGASQDNFDPGIIDAGITSAQCGNGDDVRPRRDDDDDVGNYDDDKYGYRVYPRRWLVLFHLSLLNVLSDWTGLSVAPIATLVSEAYSHEEGAIQPEKLVTVFLIASSICTAMEPFLLSRLGLRKMVVLGAFFNMLGSMVKSGGFPPIVSIESFQSGQRGIYALYSGFFLVGLSQPLFQCTPALLSASWFPEKERTLATSIALNANQLGVGCAFVVGALWVRSSSDIPTYFGALSALSTLAFIGVLLQFEDAPPTPPSGSSKVMRGTMEVSVRELLRRASIRMQVGATNGWNGGMGKNGSFSASANSNSFLEETPVEYGNAPGLRNQTEPSSPHQSLLSAAASYTMDEYPYSRSFDCDGVEPTVTQTPHHLEIDIRDNQVLLAARACLARPGFVHALVVFSASGVVILTLSTYLDYLLRVGHSDNYGNGGDNGNDDADGSSPGFYVALIGGLFQIILVVSSVVVGSVTDKTRSYFLVTMALLVLAAFALAECGVSLDEHRGGDVRWTLLLVAGLIGPLIPVSTELAVEMAYPLCENTVLVILQLICNLLCVLFIPLFQATKYVGVTATTMDGGDDDDGAVMGGGRPPYTFSFYLLILLCASSAVFFATFDGKYLRLEAELEKKRDRPQPNRQRRSEEEDASLII